MRDFPKPIKRVLRQLNDLAYERELHLALEQLDQSFTAWREGTIDSFELNDRIHKHHNGVSRELWSRYTGYRDADMFVAVAIVKGIIKEQEVPAEVLEAISRQLAFYRSHLELDEPQDPEA